MKQVVLTPDGIAVENVPSPDIGPGQILVQMAFSCISPGTERTSAARAAEPLWRQALREPARTADRIVDLAGEGMTGAGQRLRERRARIRPTGYSASGVVVACGWGVHDLRPGDLVACSGAGHANHAEVLAVPRNLVTRVPDGVPLEAAATVTLGAIALHGVRRAEPTLGETFVVVGLGAVGQLTAQILRLNGCRVLVTDVDPLRADLAVSLGADGALDASGTDPAGEIRLRTEGRGADGVIITAASHSDEIVARAFHMCRQKGRVVLVGDVGLNLHREDLYAGELDLRISTSTGPGRYDPTYEEGGVDYPIGYVRWTENRNMQTVLELLAGSRLSVEQLLSGPWELGDAVEAFKALDREPTPVLVLLRGSSKTPSQGPPAPRPRTSSGTLHDRPLRVAVVGAGSFARTVHLPNLLEQPESFEVYSVVARHGTTALEVKRAFRARHATTDVDEILADPAVDAVLIATRHDLHAPLTLRALEAGKHVLVEKPPAINAQQLSDLREWFEGRPDSPVLMTAFNRRFSPLIAPLRTWLGERLAPAMLSYEMNAGFLPSSHWVHGPEGGGRNVGEACHVYDLARCLLGSEPTEIAGVAVNPRTGPYRSDDNFVATLAFGDGSVTVLTYSAMGAPEHPKERLTVHSGGRTAVLDDYRRLDLGGSTRPVENRRPAKGHREELTAFAEAVRGSSPWPISLEEQLGAVEVALSVDRLLPGRSPS
ncbi:MAG TPA: bi-domain-containing oxidoreductase [Acidimicrobiales bacterium]|nr:bi-domain-containing oxidoreductase [Acidimicrobiales bacterium]